MSFRINRLISLVLAVLTCDLFTKNKNSPSHWLWLSERRLRIPVLVCSVSLFSSHPRPLSLSLSLTFPSHPVYLPPSFAFCHRPLSLAPRAQVWTEPTPSDPALGAGDMRALCLYDSPKNRRIMSLWAMLLRDVRATVWHTCFLDVRTFGTTNVCILMSNSYNRFV